MIAGNLFKTIFGDQVDPAVTYVDNISQIADDRHCGEGGSAFRDLRDDICIRFLNAFNENLGNWRAIIRATVIQHGQIDVVHHVVRNQARSHSGSLFTIMMPPHTVGYNEETKIWLFFDTTAGGKEREYGILIVVAHHTHISRLAETQVAVLR